MDNTDIVVGDMCRRSTRETKEGDSEEVVAVEHYVDDGGGNAGGGGKKPGMW